ncbi:MAG TPA: MBL fold metallo-hydrolase [Desulfobacteraceae bacterium]|nr:MBL fold metallo-hydrolase [Desulfobacteraceae bacterium]
MSITVHTLCDNTVSGINFEAEWGWSALVTIGETRILLDTGARCAAVRNADTLGIDLNSIDRIVLSHAHRDHTGGLFEVLRRTGPVDIYAHPAVWERKCKTGANFENPMYNGVPYSRLDLEGRARFSLHKEPVRLAEGLTTTGEVPMVTDFEGPEPVFYVQEDGGLRHDTFPDDLALAAETSKGLVLVLGCAHRGMINTILHARKITGEKRVHAVLGGTHLYPKNKEQVARTIEALKELGVEKIGVSHCTGLTAAMEVARAFGDRFFFNNAGNTVTF